jgi:hypothetical protein
LGYNWCYSFNPYFIKVLEIGFLRREGIMNKIEVIHPPILLKVMDENGVMRFVNLCQSGDFGIKSEHEPMVIISRKEYEELLEQAKRPI